MPKPMPLNTRLRTAAELRFEALELRRTILRMAADKGEGYVAQGMDIADLLAVVYYRELDYDPDDPAWSGRDRFVLSIGHYSIALYAVLHRIGYIPETKLDDFGLNGADLALSTFDDQPGVEITGGSLGQGLGQAVGMALGYRLDKHPGRIICTLSDGELQEGSVWEAAMAASSHRIDNLVAVIDCNGIQADGPTVLDIEPIADKWRAFGWDTREIDGNDIEAIMAAFDQLRERDGRPKAIILRTTPGKGIPTLERRDRAHFVRVDPNEWALLSEELESNNG
ncbi:transketolase [Cryobacterium sp. Y62]|uniref:transketolase n=1 Tax=Cryobacterium sp. Y62 TaxID=2048284 RepID=UPI0018EDFD5D|nr:transketolase [Cryobacterium sp. Y62]